MGVLGLLGVAVVVLAACGAPDTGSPGALGAGQISRNDPAPEFSFTTFEGRAISLADLRGKVVVLNFWASWCVPCRAEMPYFESTYRAQRASGVEFVGLALQDDPQSARAFLNELGITYPTGPDEGNQVALRYLVTGLPTTVFITPDGRISRKWAGPISERELVGAIDDTRR